MHRIFILFLFLHAPAFASVSMTIETLPRDEFRVSGAYVSDSNSTPNPVYAGGRSSRVGLALTYEYDGVTRYQFFNQCAISANNYPALISQRTVGEVEYLWSQAVSGLPCTGVVGSMFGNKAKNYRACVIYTLDSGITNYPWPGSSNCEYYPPEDNNCWVSSDRVELDHGSVNSESVSGDIAYQSISVHCEKPLGVVLSMPNNGIIDLGTGLTSQVYLNDKPGGGVINGTPGGGDVIVKSILKSSGITKPGVYSNSSVIILSYN